MNRPKLLIIDDDESIRLSMKWALSQDYRILLAEDRKVALETFKKETPSLVTLDLGLPPQPQGVEEGFRTLSSILEEDPLVKVIIITGQEEKQNAIAAIGHGAYDFFCKPIQFDEVKVVLRRAFHVHKLENEHHKLQALRSRDCYEDIIGASPQMQVVFSTIDKIASSDVPVLILGESGTGKELIARAIHARSARKEGAFVPINCAAIPENLLESELFGHEKGSFTGAHTQRKGRIEAAQGGVLFFDEIGDLPLPLQVKMLRFLQEHSIERVGGRKRIQIETRVLAATNSDLNEAIRENRFREDLYYRLGVITIQVPPLRDRKGDILLLSNAFLQRYSAEQKKKTGGFTQQAVLLLESHPWPGNVRELENRVKRGIIMAQKSKIGPEDLELGSRDDGMRLKDARESVERKLILESLARHGNNLSKVATELGISRPTLYELMEKLHINKKEK